MTTTGMTIRYALMSTRLAFRNLRFLVLTVALPLLLFLLYANLYQGQDAGDGLSVVAYLMVSMASFGCIGAAINTGARIAVTNLVKLIPGWGSAVGAASSFAATYAVGRVMDRYFEKGAGDITALKDEFKAAEKEGKKAFKESKEQIAEKEAATKAKLDALNAEYKAGSIDQATYEKRAAELA